MPPDEVEEFLKFLDNVSLQLTCLLDIDGERNLKKIYSKHRPTSSSGGSASSKIIKIRKSSSSRVTSSASVQHRDAGNQRKQQKAARTNKQPTNRARGRRRSKQQQQQEDAKQPSVLADQNRELEQTNSHTLTILRHQDPHQATHLHDLHSIKPIGIGSESHPLEVQLSLGLTDELSIEHGTSISPATHLSPMEPSPLGQFNHSLNHQHYYNPSRGALDPFHLHDEFSSHESVPIANETTHQLVASPDHHQSQHQDHHHHHHHLQHHQHQDSFAHQHHQLDHNQHQQQPGPNIHGQHQSSQQSGTAIQTQQQHLPNVSDGNFSTLPSISDCYSQPAIIHHHGSQHHLQNRHPQQHLHHLHHQQQHHHHHQASLQYQTTMDQQWLNSSSLTAENNISILEAHSHSTGDHVVPISPGPNQNLDQVQFSSSLYHHGYYGQQADHLDPFHPITSDDFSANSATLAADNNQMHRMRQEQQQQHSHLNDGSNNYDHSHIHQIRGESHQLTNSSTSYNGEHQQNQSGHHGSSHHSHSSSQQQQQQHQHQHHHHLTHMPHLISGIEPSNVIIQDINLASATWTSSEDLYSI